jgi:hypothetical protein
MNLVWTLIHHVARVLIFALVCVQTITPAMAVEREDWLRYWTTVSDDGFGSARAEVTHVTAVRDVDLDEEDITIRLPVRQQIANNNELAFRRLAGAELVREEPVAGKDLSQWRRVSEEVLDEMRGGFQNGPGGVFMSFGIERSVFHNGELVGSTALNIPDLSKFTGHPTDAFTFTQNGRGNALPSDLATLPPFMTIVQNSLDNQKLQSETIINATVEALGWARSLERGNALSEAIVDAIRH